MAGRLRTIKFVSLLAVTAACFVPQVRQLAALPTEVTLTTQDKVTLPRPEGYRLSHSSNHLVEPDSSYPSCVTIQSSSPGETSVDGKVLGLIPWRTRVRVVPTERVVVGGQAVGIKLSSDGPIVVGYRHLRDGTSPAANAKVLVGDVILSVNHQSVHSATDLQRAMRHEGSPLQLTVRRGRATKHISVVCPRNTGTPELGLFVRDKTVGVGTLTFIDPKNHTFGALGHVITDIDTGQPVVGQGSIYPAMITGLQRGRIGAPGEKKGTFSLQGSTLGSIDENTPYGIFGTIPAVAQSARSVPVALPSQVHTGEAKIYTVLHGSQVESFDVRIESVARQSEPSTKSMIIRVTDPRLLSQTGGIVQGMSGSPIVQDGRLVGAVTHVFVSDPTRGYGVYAMWMIQEAQTHRQSAPAWTAWSHWFRRAV
ncbi:SpoIVB peptidase [Alicyclobacillus acidiphilus]|uniref:SpoIVB peptidase n=1 Tax=Alicyclobacillus acidiphilus TaxID=182455 RepID=UPI00082AF708|nr:SpoIVB peptidase [Alicyclobacillus acidiphilus]